MGRLEHCKQISLACVGSACSDLATLGLSALMVCVLSQSTLLRLQVALQGNCLRWALACVHFPGISHSGSGSWVLHKGTDSVGPAFCALLRSQQLRRPGAWLPLLRCGASYHLPHSSCLVSRVHRLRCAVCLFWGADLWLLPSRQMSSIQDRLVGNWEPAHSLLVDPSLGLSLPLSGSGCHHLPPCLRWGMGRSAAG